MTPDPLTAALDQLAAHHDHLSRLDAREAAHHAAVSGQLTQLGALITTMGQTLQDDTAALARLESLASQVSDLAAHLAGPGPDDDDDQRYQPGPAPAWWKLSGPDRREPAARLQAWVEQVYRPGYGHLAAALGGCWQSHDLCLYGLDIASQLWAALYLQPARSTALLSAQAEYQARILPALAAQLRTETTGCGHNQTRAYPRSRP
jgi:hypothetical protein